MKRAWIIAPVLAAAAWYFLAGGAPTSAPEVSEAASASPVVAAKTQRPSSLPQRTWAVPSFGRITGRVTDSRGHAVAGARIVASGPTPQQTTSLDDGRFALNRLLPGDYVLLASQDVLASDALGPVPVADGEELRDLTLVLETGAALSGTVKSALDGTPIPKAVVSAGAGQSTSDERGRYRLTGLPSGALTVTAWADGFVPRTSEVQLKRGQERTGADLHLERGARVHGHVSASGMPAVGAEIFAARYGFAARLSSLVPVAVSGPDGAFAGTVPAGRLELVAQLQGYAEARTQELELAAGEDREANLTLGPGGVLFGTVRDASGKGVAGCRVDAFDSVAGRLAQAGSTAADGSYSIAGLPTAIYLASATCASGRAETAGLRISEGDSTQADLALGQGSLEGRVVDASGNPVVAAQVAVRADGSPAPDVPMTMTREGGRFEVHGLSGTRFTISASAPSGRAERSGVSAGARNVELVIGSGELAGVVVSDRGEPVPDFTVYAEPASMGDARPRSQRYLSPSGEFRMPLAPGRYRVKVGAPGYGASPPLEASVRSGGDGAKLRVELPHGVPVRGRVLDEKGSPVGGVTVASHPNLLWAYGRAAAVPQGAFAVTDASGAFTLSGVPPGKAVLWAHGEGVVQRGAKEIRVAEPGTEGVEIRVTQARHDDGEREFGGVGMTLSVQEGRVFIAEVFEGGPAREAGVREGDEILQVDGAPIAGQSLSDVIARIRGVIGTSVMLGLSRGGHEFAVAIARASVKF